MSTATAYSHEKEARVVLRYQWHVWAFTILATLLWLNAGILSTRGSGDEPDTTVVSYALIALSLSLYAILLLTHARPDKAWPTPTTRPDCYREWHEALDKTGSVGGIIVFVLTPVVALQATLGSKVGLDPSIATTVVGILTVLGAYTALSDLRPALHAASGHQYRVPFIEGPGPTIVRGLALLIVWLAMFALGHLCGN